ncbi:hypothetical protein QQF64_003263 [Cirrhinus molitorella]|uniref:Uncharacterized protein n=1 Tax=Cirrhinus molitorella TaxID=172907 RepID=A0ABR3MJJ0_9TELE
MMHANNAPCAEHHDAEATYNKHKEAWPGLAWHAKRRDKYVKDVRHAASPKQRKKGETKPTDTDRPHCRRPAISKLGLVARLDSIDIETLKLSYPKLCSGLGEVRQPYVISLKPGATPFSLKTPRRIPLPLMGKVKEELHRMETLGVISRVEEQQIGVPGWWWSRRSRVLLEYVAVVWEKYDSLM